MSEVLRPYAYYETETGKLIGISAYGAVFRANGDKAWRSGRTFYLYRNKKSLKLKSVYRSQSDTAYFAIANPTQSHLLPDPERENESIEHEMFKQSILNSGQIKVRLDGGKETYTIEIINGREEYQIRSDSEKCIVDLHVRFLDDRDLHWKFGTILIIEVYKTHRSSERKKTFLKNKLLPALEIAVPSCFHDIKIKSEEEEQEIEQKMSSYIQEFTLDADLISAPVKPFYKKIVSIIEIATKEKRDAEENSKKLESNLATQFEKNRELEDALKKMAQGVESQKTAITQNHLKIKNLESSLKEERNLFWALSVVSVFLVLFSLFSNNILNFFKKII